MGDVTLTPFEQPFRATIAPPGSKSLTNRALVLAALAKGTSQLSNVLFADDTLVMLDNLAKLGFQLDIDRDARSVVVHGRGGRIDSTAAELFCGNSGTTIRFLAALCALGKGEYTLDGVPRMRQRPIRDLVDLLRNLGVRVEYLAEDGFPPLRILADGLPGGVLQYSSTVSSQYLSAVLMASPYARHEVRVDLAGEQTSWPYVAMTMQLMDRFGHTPELLRDPSTGRPKQIIAPVGRYAATQYNVEPDASNATYFLAVAAIRPGAKVTIEGLGKGSLQGDVGFADVLRRMGADLVFGRDFITVMGTETLEGIEVDLRDMPDTAQTLAVVALFAQGETIIRGLHTLRVKETDRLAALSNELQKFGATVTIDGDDMLTIEPPKLLRRAEVDTYDDHRMAMSFAIAGTRVEHVVIKNAECVNKTYPAFFADLENLREQ
jgi:3-phosphoshikimate 1-carboxyvinyltransferase